MFDVLESIESLPMLFLACVASGLGFPIPEDAILLYAGIRIADGRFALATALPVVLAGVLTRDVLAWMIGRFLGERLLGSRWLQRILPPAKIDKARVLLAERGAAAVVLGRFMVGFRVTMFVAAGAARVPITTFLAADGLALLVGVPLEVAIGAVVGPPVIELAGRVLAGSGVAWLGLALVVGVALAWRRRRASRHQA